MPATTLNSNWSHRLKYKKEWDVTGENMEFLNSFGKCKELLQKRLLYPSHTNWFSLQKLCPPNEFIWGRFPQQDSEAREKPSREKKYLQKRIGGHVGEGSTPAILQFIYLGWHLIVLLSAFKCLSTCNYCSRGSNLGVFCFPQHPHIPHRVTAHITLERPPNPHESVFRAFGRLPWGQETTEIRILTTCTCWHVSIICTASSMCTVFQTHIV